MTANKTRDNEQVAKVEAVLDAGQDAVEKVIRAGEDVIGMIDVDKTVKTVSAEAERLNKVMFGGYGRFAEQNRDNFEACAASFGIAARGGEAIGREIVEFARAAFQANVENGKKTLTAKTANEFFNMQQTFMQANVESMLTTGAKLAGMSLTTTSEALEPVQKRANAALDTYFGVTPA